MVKKGIPAVRSAMDYAKTPHTLQLDGLKMHSKRAGSRKTDRELHADSFNNKIISQNNPISLRVLDWASEIIFIEERHQWSTAEIWCWIVKFVDRTFKNYPCTLLEHVQQSSAKLMNNLVKVKDRKDFNLLHQQLQREENSRGLKYGVGTNSKSLAKARAILCFVNR